MLSCLFVCRGMSHERTGERLTKNSDIYIYRELIVIECLHVYRIEPAWSKIPYAYEGYEKVPRKNQRCGGLEVAGSVGEYDSVTLRGVHKEAFVMRGNAVRLALSSPR